MPVRFWRRASMINPYLHSLFGQILPPSTAALGVTRWIASLGDFHVSRYRTQGDERESLKAAPPVSGHSTLASFAKYDPESSSWKTSQLSLFGDSIPFSATWPQAGTMRSGVSSERTTSELPTGENASSFLPGDPMASPVMNPSLWPTVTAQDSRGSGSADYSTESGRHSGTTLSDATKVWPSPTGYDADTRQPGKVKLDHAAEAWDTDEPLGPEVLSMSETWKTPNARDWKSGRVSITTLDKNSRPLNEQVEAMFPTPSASTAGYSKGGSAGRVGKIRPSLNTLAAKGDLPQSEVPTSRSSRPVPNKKTSGPKSSKSGPTSRRSLKLLSPNFVEWLMGIPIGWSGLSAIGTIDSELSAMRSALYKLRWP